MTDKKTRILFVGNSFTARNNLPALLAQLVAAGDKGQLEHELVSAGGASLRLHLNKGDAAQHLQQAHWDYVVLQEQSTLPIKNAERTGENMRDFDVLIKEAGARTVLYMTWARQDAPIAQQAITDAYSQIGQRLKATVVPAGLAWQQCLRQQPGIVLHDKDKSHPTLAGTYLAACAFYTILFAGRAKKMPTIDLALDADTTSALQTIAQQTCNAFKKKGN
jgi:hypothetical protein